MLHQLTLLLSRLDPYKTHGGASDRFADRLGVGSIILVTLDIGLHILRRHQTHLMAELGEFARPIVRCGAGFHADQAWRQRLEERLHLAAAERPPDHDLLGRVNAVNLEHVLGEIQTDRGNLHVGGSSCDSSNNDHPTALRCRERAPSTTPESDMPRYSITSSAAKKKRPRSRRGSGLGELTRYSYSSIVSAW